MVLVIEISRGLYIVRAMARTGSEWHLASTQSWRGRGPKRGHASRVSLDLPENAEMPSTGKFFVIQRSVFEDSGRQIVLISPTFVVVGNVHAVVIWFVICFSSFRRSRLQKISNFLREPLRAAACC